MKKFSYGEKELNYLCQDLKLAKLIEKYGFIEREVKSNIFLAVIEGILAQQISNKAFETVLDRFKRLINLIVTPENVAKFSAEELKTCGISLKKATWIKEFAEKVKNKEFDIEKLKRLEDEDAVRILISLNGIGKWTAQMILIFSLERKDIITLDDFGIRKGMIVLYGVEDVKKLKTIAKTYSPYGTIASFYIWEFANKL